MNRTKVLLLFGGESTEHDVSTASAKNVYAALDDAKFDTTLCFIDKDGRWWLKDSFDEYGNDAANALAIELGSSTLVTAGGERITPDVILPILHGSNGEDGSVQGLAQLLHVPIVGCDMTSSAVAMNKYLTKQTAMANGIKVTPFTTHRRGGVVPSYETLVSSLGESLFVKPANAGSSVGVNKATNQQELDQALEKAHQFSDLVLIERAIEARELEVAIIGNYPDIKASSVGEIKPQGEFYSYESKYAAGSTSEVIIPADVPSEVSDEIRQQAVRIFEFLGGSGLARVDFFLDKVSGELYFNEINTIPGFTDISMYPKLWGNEGIHYPQLIERLIGLALEK